LARVDELLSGVGAGTGRRGGGFLKKSNKRHGIYRQRQFVAQLIL